MRTLLNSLPELDDEYIEVRTVAARFLLRYRLDLLKLTLDLYKEHNQNFILLTRILLFFVFIDILYSIYINYVINISSQIRYNNIYNNYI